MYLILLYDDLYEFFHPSSQILKKDHVRPGGEEATCRQRTNGVVAPRMPPAQMIRKAVPSFCRRSQIMSKSNDSFTSSGFGCCSVFFFGFADPKKKTGLDPIQAEHVLNMLSRLEWGEEEPTCSSMTSKLG